MVLHVLSVDIVVHDGAAQVVEFPGPCQCGTDMMSIIDCSVSTGDLPAAPISVMVRRRVLLQDLDAVLPVHPVEVITNSSSGTG